MDFFNSWLQGIIVAVVISTIIELIAPSGNTKKYIKVVLGMYIVFNIITPIINQFSDSEFEISSIINIEQYTKKMDNYKEHTDSIDINSTNDKNIKQIYVSNLKNDMKMKLEDRGYSVKKIIIDIENDENYTLKSVSLVLEKEDIEEKQKEEETNKVFINEIEKVNIQIGNNISDEENQKEEKSSITEKDKKEVKNYLSSVYEINEKQITIT